MTTTLTHPMVGPRPAQQVRRRSTGWFRRQKYDILTVGTLLGVVGLVAGVNMSQYPLRFEDEGTYIAQAWAMEYRGTIAHYTYWYDHPFLGWAQLAGWDILTDVFDRYESSIAAGREFMLVVSLVSGLLVYVVARRLGMGQVLAAAAVLLFALSPLAVTFHRFILLDNIAVMWLLGAFALALSPRKHIGAMAGSGACMAVAILSKETTVVLLPALLYQLVQNSDRRNRRYSITVFVVVLTMLTASYALYAALNGELIPGDGHVSLLGALAWQLFDREGSGSILTAGSGAQGLASLWVGLDPWLLGLAVVLVPFGLYYRRLRPITVALVVQLLMLLRTGYLPFPYVINLLPFAALIVAGVAQAAWHNGRRRRHSTSGRYSQRSIVVVASLAVIACITPIWATKLTQYMTLDVDHPNREAVTWVNANVPRSDRIVFDSGLWLDLVRRGFDAPEATWVYKTETDPAVTAAIGGWEGIDYIVVAEATLTPINQATFPTLFTAKEHAVKVASFGTGGNQISILKVNHGK